MSRGRSEEGGRLEGARDPDLGEPLTWKEVITICLCTGEVPPSQTIYMMMVSWPLPHGSGF